MTTPSYLLKVVAGPDEGASIDVDARVRTIGRARDVDMVLRDLSVSRRHVQVAASAAGVRVVLCAGAAPFVVDGQPLDTIDARPGDRVVIGNTVIVIFAAPAEADASATAPSERLDIRTLLTGAAADVRGLAAAHALIEALDAADEREAAEAAVLRWAATHAHASAIDVTSGEPHPSGFDAASAAPRDAEVLERAGDDGQTTIIAVPAPGDASTWVTFTCRIPPERVSDSLRRMLVVAGRLAGSALTRVRRLEAADQEKAELRALSVGSARAFLGTSPAAQDLARLIPRLAASDAVVLLQGETGAGKTFVARLIHESGARKSEPLRIINCATIPENLLENELFGHDKGAFTGAVGVHHGALEAAGRGTVFLDEIGELPLACQAKLLSVLDERRFQRLGSNRPITLHARVLAATNRDLEAMVKNKTFRGDLYYRLGAVRVTVPALRDRAADLPLLARQILSDYAASAGRRIDGFSPAALRRIVQYPWPGNVRELRNAIEHAVVLGDGPLVEPTDFPTALQGPPEDPPDDALPTVLRLPARLAWVERCAIEAALRETGGNRTRAAALLGIHRQTLYNKLNEAEGDGDKVK